MVASHFSSPKKKKDNNNNSKMLNQNQNNIADQPEPKRPRVSVTSDPDQNCSRCIAKPETTKTADEDSGREKLTRHRMEMAEALWIPDVWGQESFLKEWVDCSAFDSSLVPKGVASARQALVEECRRANSANSEPVL